MRILLSLLICVLAGMLLSNLVSGLIWNLAGLDLANILEGEQLAAGERNVFRIGLLISHLGTFLIPGIIFCLYFLKEPRISFLQLNHPVKKNQVILWGLTILFSYPMIAQLAEWNTAIPLPDWMTASQSDAMALLEQTLKMESVSEFLISLFLVGVAAAIGEELIFRGIIQKILIRHWSNPHLAIIVASLIFGGFHMQFERLIPLSVLGLILGYSYYFSKSLWIPIILHFLNNSFQILSIYAVSRNGEMPDIGNVPDLPIALVLVSLISTIAFALWASGISQRSYESRP